MRPAVPIDRVDRLAYQVLVETISLTLIGKMNTPVFGSRLLRQHGVITSDPTPVLNSIERMTHCWSFAWCFTPWYG